MTNRLTQNINPNREHFFSLVIAGRVGKGSSLAQGTDKVRDKVLRADLLITAVGGALRQFENFLHRDAGPKFLL